MKDDVQAINRTMEWSLILVTGPTILLFMIVIFFIGRQIVVEIGSVSRLSDLIRQSNFSNLYSHGKSICCKET
jgi:hypothetical protein